MRSRRRSRRVSRVPITPRGAARSSKSANHISKASDAAMSSDRQLVSSGSPFESVIGFSRAVRIGGLICVAGPAPIAADGSTVGVRDAGVQAKRCLEIIQRALESAGASLDAVVRTRVLLTRIQDWPSVAQVH